MSNKPKEIDLDQVERLAAQGLSQEQIGHCLGIHRDTVTRRKKSDAEFAEALKRGQSKGIEQVANALFESAKAGNTTAQIFFLKNRDPEKWSDKQQADVRGTFELKWLP